MKRNKLKKQGLIVEEWREKMSVWEWTAPVKKWYDASESTE